MPEPKHGFIIPPNGRVDSRTLTSQDLKEVINGYLEYVAVWYLGKPCTMVVDEDGISKGLQPNARATAIYWTATILGKTGSTCRPIEDPLIYGPAVLFLVDKRTFDL